MDCMRNHFSDDVLLGGKYRTICPLNHGSFGLVFKALDITTNKLVALKCITKPLPTSLPTSDYAVDEQSEEFVVHYLLGRHPNIVNLMNHFETDAHIYLELEYCPNGDLYEAIRLGRGPGETENIRDAMLQLIDAVEYMHSKGVYHRDIKPENILLSETGDIKLGDFGLATRHHVSSEAAVGSDRYMAPEQMEPPEGGYFPAKADVWAIGICMLNILFSRNPFAAPALSDPLFFDFAADRQSLFDVFPDMSQDTFQVLLHCLAIDPENRSLRLARDAVTRVVSFTLDDESLDEFCAAPAVMATANREPLRTPSVSVMPSPQLEPIGAFPWAKALAMTLPARQSSTIGPTGISDTGLDNCFAYHPLTKAAYPSSPDDDASMVSFVDSGLGVSIDSSNISPWLQKTFGKSKPFGNVGSLPPTAARAVPSFVTAFGNDVKSKSWSDIWDEDFAEANHLAGISENDVSVEHCRAPTDTLAGTNSTGSNTPRMALSEITNLEPLCHSQTMLSDKNSTIAEDTGFLFEEHDEAPPAMKSPMSSSKSSPPSKRSIEDKWSALGDRRRGHRPIKPFLNYGSSPMSSDKRTRPNSVRRHLSWNIWSPNNSKQDSCLVAPSDVPKHRNMGKDWRNTASLFKDPSAAHRSSPLEWVWRL